MKQPLPLKITQINARASSPLSKIFAKTKFLTTLTQIVHQYLDDSLLIHCKVANFDKGCLTLETDSPAWITHLRFQTPNLLTKLRQHPELNNLARIKHQTAMVFETTHKKTPPKAISSSSTSLLAETAAGITSPNLKRSLEKLIRDK